MPSYSFFISLFGALICTSWWIYLSSYKNLTPKVKLPEHLSTLKFNIQNLNSEVDPNIECHTVPAAYPLTVCVHPDNDNMSKCMRKGGHWEKPFTDHLTRVFEAHPAASLLDMGANVGYHSLFFAGQGKRVVAVEPSAASVERIKAGAQQMGVTDRMTVLRNVVSDGKDVVFHNNGNKLHSMVLDQANKQKDNVDSTSDEQMQSVTINDMLHLDLGDEIVFKLDIERQETRALNAAADLFDQRHVLIVTMEAFTVRKAKSTADFVWNFFNSRGYRMFSDRGVEITADMPRKSWTSDVWFVSPRCAECIPNEISRVRRCTL